MTPEIVGPMAGATDMTVVMKPMVLPRVSGGASVITVVISSGIMIAVPEAWTTRARTSTWRFGARRGDQRAQGEQRHRPDEDRPRVHPLQQKAGDWNDHGHRSGETPWSTIARRRQ